MAAPGLKIAIVGAGISGLSTYLFLKKQLPSTLPYELDIFESHSSPNLKERNSSHEDPKVREAASFIGGGLGVAPNGMQILRDMDPDIHDAVLSQGYPTLRFQMKNSLNWTLGSMPTSDSNMQIPETMVMSSRQGVWDCLRDKVPSKALQTGKSLVKIDRGQGLQPVLHFSDGTKSGEFDLVVGADGVKSIVKAAIMQPERFAPVYQGVCGIGGFVPSSCLHPVPPNQILKAPQSPVVMTFGAEGFFGYGPCETDFASTSPHLTAVEMKNNKALPYGTHAMWWSTFEADEPDQHTKNVDMEAAHKQLLERHSRWRDPVIQKILAAPSTSGMTATYVTPKLGTWTGDGIVLIGDAAHCLPSSSGQGVSQALEDAQSLAILLTQYLQDDSFSVSAVDSSAARSKRALQIQAATRAFQTIRKPRVEKILDVSSRMGNRKKRMSLIEEWTTYVFMWILCAFMTWFNPGMYDAWDVQAETRKVIEAQRKQLQGSVSHAKKD